MTNLQTKVIRSENEYIKYCFFDESAENIFFINSKGDLVMSQLDDEVASNIGFCNKANNVKIMSVSINRQYVIF